MRSSRHHHRERRGDPKRLPKNLRFDGKSSWLSFKQKFESYKSVLQWDDSECRDYLNWALEGKALDFFTITTRMGEHYSYRQIMKKLENRFGSKELTETARAKFQQSFQQSDESLEDWADRVLTLATNAFRDLPESHRMQEAISKFCQGCIDKEAAKHACFEHPRSMQAALDAIKHHQYISQAVEGKKHSSRRREDVNVNTVSSVSEARVEQMIAKAIDSLASKLQKLETTVKPSNSQQPTSSPKQARSPKKDIYCFFCKKRGHIKKECRMYKNWLRKKETKEITNEGQQENDLNK